MALAGMLGTKEWSTGILGTLCWKLLVLEWRKHSYM